MQIAASTVGNLTDEGVNQRLRMGLVIGLLTLAGATLMVKFGVSSWYRLALLLPFFFASSAVTQAIFRTCAALAFMGRCECGPGEDKPVGDAAKRSKMKRDAAKVMLWSLTSAVALTAVFVAVQ